ncbi:hypothetical protein pb186bvf_017497 [Paramecium bursaria]
MEFSHIQVKIVNLKDCFIILLELHNNEESQINRFNKYIISKRLIFVEKYKIYFRKLKKNFFQYQKKKLFGKQIFIESNIIYSKIL